MRFDKKILFLLLFVTVISQHVFSQSKTGVLVMAHGGSPAWESSIKDVVNPVRQKYPAEIAFGMADPMTLQEAINKLEKQGVSTIVIVPLFISSHSPILRQTEFLLGIRKELADEPMIMTHGSPAAGGGNHNHGGGSRTYNGEESTIATLDPVVYYSKIILGKPLDNHPLVGEILFERINEFSKTPSNETIILVAHGPNGEEDNKGWLKNLESLSEQIKGLQAKSNGEAFKKVAFATVRDDADKKVYNEAKKVLRGMVETANQDGKTIVVPVVLATGGIEKGIQKRLDGLDYTWVNKALLPHENIRLFIEQAVTNAGF